MAHARAFTRYFRPPQLTKRKIVYKTIKNSRQKTRKENPGCKHYINSTTDTKSFFYFLGHQLSQHLTLEIPELDLIQSFSGSRSINQ